MIYNVFFQAQCWPNCMKTLGSWYPDKVRNSVFGIFGTCAFVGGIVGTALAVSIADYFVKLNPVNLKS